MSPMGGRMFDGVRERETGGVVGTSLVLARVGRDRDFDNRPGWDRN